MLTRPDGSTKDGAMMTAAAQTRDGLSFGPFSLVASERLLTKDGAPVELGARALDILIALLSRPNEVVSKKDLMARVWPDVTVEEGSLRFHIAGLRKALGDGKDGARYITTLAGRGYCFVAPISRSSDQSPVLATVAASFPHANLPSRLIRMVGRERRRSQAVGSTDRFALRHHRRRRRRRQDHRRGRGRASSDRGLRGRRAVRRSRNAERSRSGGHGRRLHAGAVRFSPTTQRPA